MADGDYIVADTDHTVVFDEADLWADVLRRLEVFSIAPKTLTDLVNLPAKTRPDLLAGRVVANRLRFQALDLGLEPLCSTVIHRIVREFGLDGCWRRRADDLDADIIETPRALITGGFPVIVYHGTSDVYLDDIKVQGLRVDAASNWAKGGRDHVYLAAEAQVSAFHARRTAKRVGGEAIVLKCQLPEVWAVDHDVKAQMVDNPEVPHSDERFLSQEAGLFAVPANIPWADIIEVRTPRCHTRFETWPVV